MNEEANIRSEFAPPVNNYQLKMNHCWIVDPVESNGICGWLICNQYLTRHVIR